MSPKRDFDNALAQAKRSRLTQAVLSNLDMLYLLLGDEDEKRATQLDALRGKLPSAERRIPPRPLASPSRVRPGSPRITLSLDATGKLLFHFPSDRRPAMALTPDADLHIVLVGLLQGLERDQQSSTLGAGLTQEQLDAMQAAWVESNPKGLPAQIEGISL